MPHLLAFPSLLNIFLQNDTVCRVVIVILSNLTGGTLILHNLIPVSGVQVGLIMKVNITSEHCAILTRYITHYRGLSTWV